MLLLFFYLRSSPVRLHREIALVLLSFAACLKYTPAVFGLLYLCERRFKEAVRLVLYGVVFFTLPFFFFGGTSIVGGYLAILHALSNLTDPRPESIIGVVLELSSLLNISGGTGLLLGKALAFLYLGIVVALFCLTEKDWKSCFLLTTLLIIFVNHSYPYTLIYLLLPILLFLKETDCASCKADYMYSAFFVLVLASYPFLKIPVPTATFITNYFFLYAFIFIVMVDKLRNAFAHRKAGKAGRAA